MKKYSEKQILEEGLLIEQIKKEPRLFSVLFDRYHTAILNTIYSQVREKSLAEDLTQQVFIKAFESIKKYKNQGLPYGAYLYRIAHNDCKAFFRKQKKQRAISLDQDFYQSIAQEVEEPSKDLMPALVQLLEQLSEDEVAFIELKYFECSSIKEIAFILNMSESNVKVTAHRLIKKLKKLIP